jgi:hypothetical protein
MRKLEIVFVVALLLVASVGATGCNSGKRRSVKTVSVSGTVTLDGQPLEGVEVCFEAGTHIGSGVTRADGKYDLVAGAEPGPNQIYFKPVAATGGPDMGEGMDAGQFEAMAAGGGAPPPGVKLDTGPKLPERYTDPAKSNVKFDVPAEGAENVDFRLSSS